jgi:hypothetical protein
MHAQGSPGRGLDVKVSTMVVEYSGLAVTLGGKAETSMHRGLSRSDAEQWAREHLGPYRPRAGSRITHTPRRDDRMLAGRP